MTDSSTAPALEEDFGKYFEQLSDLGDKTPPTTFGSEDPPPAPEPAPETIPAPAETIEAPVSEILEPDPVDPPPAPEPVKPPPTEELLERFVRAVETRQPTPQQQQVQPEPAPQLFAPDEIEALATFEKDWPDVARALQLMLRGTVQHNNAQVFRQLGDVLGPQLASMQTVQVSHQLMTLRSAIPDYDEVRDPVINWVNTDNSIPAYLRTAYKGVIEQGDVSDIADLVDRWRQVSGKAAPARTAAPAPAATKPANELSEAAKQAAASLAPVVSKRTVTAPSTPTTFEDAFEVAAQAMAKA